MVGLVTSLMVNGKVGGNSMGAFRNTFRTFASKSCNPDDWRKYFSEYCVGDWISEGDGVLQYYENNEEYSLVINHWLNQGFLMEQGCRNLDTNRTEWCKLSLSDRGRLTEFAEQDDLHFPIGCFISPSQAWLVVEDFLRKPTQLSPRVQWVDYSEIVWPDP